jgi:putative zinc finger protein
MNCREFKSQHVGFIDDVLSAADMADMRQHVRACPRCAMLDVRIRRSLLVIRNLPQIEPSSDFYARLSERLRNAPPPAARRTSSIATTVVVGAALAAAIYFAMAVGVQRGPATVAPRASSVASRTQPTPDPISDATLVAAVPAGVPIWPAMFMVGELPMHLANVELVDNGIGR